MQTSIYYLEPQTIIECEKLTRKLWNAMQQLQRENHNFVRVNSEFVFVCNLVKEICCHQSLWNKSSELSIYREMENLLLF